MSGISRSKNNIEILEQRIAPAGLINENGFRPAQPNTPLLLHAGEGLTTGAGGGAGNYLLYVEKGSAMIFTTDLNGNGVVDFNEITGISAGDGLRLISFVDIHGDIVTNLRADGTLSDSDNDSSNNDSRLGGDGRVLLNSTIEKIEMRSVRASDFAVTPDTDLNGDGEVDQSYLQQRLVLSTYSIFGNVIAGKGFGVTGGGLLIDAAGKQLQQDTFTAGNTSPDYFIDFKTSIGSILTGTAGSGRYFSFGTTRGDDVEGRLGNFHPAVGQNGGDIIGVKAASIATEFNLHSLETGNGGVGARGGNIQDIQLNGDDVGGYRLIAGNGGRGTTGGAGGGILNYSDLGSVTGTVILQTGNGGQGTTGGGGNGGLATFGEVNVSANLRITLGNGGDGFSSGGNGAGIGAAAILTPEGAVPYGVNLIGLATDRPGNLSGPLDPTVTPDHDRIGTTIPIDFNQDGVGDFVYTTNAPNQLVVVLGNPDALKGENPLVWGYDGFGNALYNKVYLDGTANAESVVVADFNGDGRQDIAVASNTDGAFDGITVYLNKFEDIAAGEDFDGDGQADFLGFELGIHSALPSLYSLETSLHASPGYRRAGINVSDITAGDFNGDGITDLAVVATYYGFGATGGLNPDQVILIMNNDSEDGTVGTGRFYADFGEKAGPGGVPAARFNQPFIRVGINMGPGEIMIEASKPNAIKAGTTADDVDFIYVAGNDDGVGGKINVYDPRSTASKGTAGSVVQSIYIGSVDTNRDLQQGTSQNVTESIKTTLRDFTVLDINGDGRADVAVLTEVPVGFIIGLVQNPAGQLQISTNVKPAPTEPDNQNSGIFLGDKGFEVGASAFGIRAYDQDRDGRYDDVLVLNYSSTTVTQDLHVISFSGGVSTPLPYNQNAKLHATYSSIHEEGRDNSITAFDAVAINTGASGGLRSHMLAAINPTKVPDIGAAAIEFWPAGPGILPSLDMDLTDNGVAIQTGSGGDALAGKGGTGGVLGGALVTKRTTDPLTGIVSTDLVGAVSITLPENETYAGEVRLFTGSGGNGFTSGGSGGNINGVTLRYATTDGGILHHSFVTIVAGDGGNGLSGAGGTGGSITASSIQSGVTYVAGDGGQGSTGGDGGSVIGNGKKGFFDTQYNGITVSAGNGGVGIKKGGNGGAITNFAPEFISSTGFAGGSYTLIAGSGGSAVLGAGGRGGSITNSGPLSTDENKLAGEIYLEAGNGGRGLTGGAGGSITKFTNDTTIPDNATIASFIAGQGGAGVSGNGGAGGSVTGVVINTKGYLSSPGFSGYQYSRVLAGDGGVSAGANGGAGGVVSNSEVSAGDGPLVVVGGAGGDGLKAGGAGGSVTSFKTTPGGGVVTKVLVIAGAGGSGHAFVVNPESDIDPAQALAVSQRAFGGVVGRGGLGGSITNFTQDTSTLARVDLIAGNGGDTVNYGATLNKKYYVGLGGSVTNVKLAGTAGNIDNTTPIAAYNDADKDGHVDQTLAEFVRQNLRLSRAEAYAVPPELLSDTMGNVGIIVGTSGRVKATEDSPGYYTRDQITGLANGSLINLTARGVMSAVAGSVDSVAAIQVAKGVTFTVGLPVIGADKAPAVTDRQYYDKDGNITTALISGGRLLDGAIFALSHPGLDGTRVFPK